MFLVAQITLALFSVFVLVGGIMGFVKAKSKASLIAGIISSVLLDICLALTLVEMFSMPGSGLGKIGITAGDVISAALAIVFFKRFRKTGAFMPAGLMIILSLLSVVILSITIFSTAH